MAGPDAVRAEVPGRGAGVHGELEELVDLGDVPRILDPHQRLDPPVEIAVHQVRTADVDDRLPPAVEPEDPGVLEEPAEDAPDPDVLAHARDAGPDRADPADDDVHRNSGLGREVERV